MPGSALLTALAIVLASFVSEDGATLFAASLSAQQLLRGETAFAAAVLGVWLGDLGVYAFARSGRGLLDRWLSSERRTQAEEWAARHGSAALAASRFIPGTRLLALVGAGLVRFPAGRFALVTLATAFAWTALLFAAVLLLAPLAPELDPVALAFAVALAGVALLALARAVLAPALARLAQSLRKYRHWEFWPAWLFYPPVALMCAWLGWKHGGLSLPTAANPAFRNGGIVGESKAQALALLQQVAPEVIAESWLLAPAPLWQRCRRLELLLHREGLFFPFVLKPDVGQRGAGFRLAHSFDEARDYLARVEAPIVVQRYVAGPHEAGIFYYRFPGAARGELFGITEKLFPSVTGDGAATFEQLLARDPRAALIAGTYLARFPQLRGRVLPAGQQVRLVEAGNHCQGCIFRDGWRLYSEPLRARIDELSQLLPGFFIGRYDVRYTSDDELRSGTGFHIIELNGAASEATNVYDPRNSLVDAYRTLYRQWELVYRVGRMNRDLGVAPSPAHAVLKDWLDYRRMAAAYPAAD